MNADGTEAQVSGITATTDTSGNYTLSNVPISTTGTGAATDFYYEVRATSGDLVVKAPAAPSSDTSVNLSPETTIAAKIISDVAEIPESTSPDVLPTEGTIENLRKTVAADVEDMTTFTPPSTASTADADMVIAALAVSSNDNNSEKFGRAYEAHSEELYLEQNKASAEDADVAGYIERVAKAACEFTDIMLPQIASDTLAESFKAGTTFTVDEVVTAFNANSSTEDITSASAISTISGLLDNLNTKIANGTEVSGDDLIVLYANRDDLSSLSSSSELDADQVLVLAHAMLPEAQRCQSAVIDYVGFVSDLVGDETLVASASFADVDIYHDRSACLEGQLKARVEIYLPSGITANGVTIAADNMTDTEGGAVASVDMTQNGDATTNWQYGSGEGEGTCLAFDQTYEYTITADLTGADDINTTVSRTIVNLPEAQITLIADFVESTQFQTGDPGDPISITDERPMFKWTPTPGEPSADLGAPAGTKVKYLYDITHFNIGEGDPEDADLVNCPGEQNDGRPYEKDYILSPIDCDVDTCNAAVAGNHVCRLHVQTLLVDEYDRMLAWSAGADMYFCIEGQSNCE